MIHSRALPPKASFKSNGKGGGAGACGVLILGRESTLIALGIRSLPRTLEEAVDAFAEYPLAEQVFGKQMRDTWISYKRDEWLSYLNHVYDWERDRFRLITRQARLMPGSLLKHQTIPA